MPNAIVNIPPDMTGLKNEVIVQKTHRYEYDHALRNCGIRFVEVETLAEYDAAFNDRTVMAHFFNAADEGEISREDWVRVAHQHGVPCFNDASADVPPIANLWNYTKMGFDLVTFSGGKGIRGPQCTGLLLGRKDLIEAAVKNNSPNSNTIGRGMKVAKEEIVGLVAAVDWLLAQDEDAMQNEFRRRAERIAERVKSLPGVETRISVPPVANHVPHLIITYDPNRIKLTGKEVMAKMREGTPRIELNPASGGGSASKGLESSTNTIVVGVWMLQPGEDLVVGRSGFARCFRRQGRVGKSKVKTQKAKVKARNEGNLCPLRRKCNFRAATGRPVGDTRSPSQEQFAGRTVFRFSLNLEF